MLGLGAVVFVHELGHYIMARRVGMTVEVFSIGFGKAIISWKHKGVKWKLGWIPFGGYVKIKGTEKEGDIEPSEIPDGFFGKKPIDRIKVALAGPMMNIVAALLVFMMIWALGGRDKTFSEYTSKIGWIDTQSELYAHGIRPGDEIVSYNGYNYKSSKDHIYAAMVAKNGVTVEGNIVDDMTKAKKPFSYTVETYQHPGALDKGILTAGVLGAAQHMIFDGKIFGGEDPFPKGSPMKDSGIQHGDRILWVDGETVYSQQHMSHVINDEKALLTVERENTIVLVRVPKKNIAKYKLSKSQENDISDWHNAGDNEGKAADSIFIPYEITSKGIVKESLNVIDGKEGDNTLERGDVIVAVDGKPVQRAYEIFEALQKKQVYIIVERNAEAQKKVSWKDADNIFDKDIDTKDLLAIINSIGTEKNITSSGNLHLLTPVVPKHHNEMYTQEERVLIEEMIAKQKHEIEKIADTEMRERAFKELENQAQQKILGIAVLRDKSVNYNPTPFVLLANIGQEIYRTVHALVAGYISPKWFAGPLGIVRVIHYGWTLGIKEALFWLAFISCNLAMVNLIPLPALDGGHVVMSLVEMITKKPLKAKTMERLIFPFMMLLMALLVYLTYQDIYRFIKRFF